MANLNESLKDAVCIDEEVFFGPISDKERKIREQFETLHRNELNGLEASKIIEDDESQNSVYKSFSVEESKYDSFDDSLNEGIDKMPQEAKRITLRKSYDKIKSKRFYDSLEDVHSLASNIDKCSISCEVENESNLNSKHFVEDSLKILSVPVASKNNFINDQVHFDDDSLAILECETTFSDSLEEVNVLESIEIEEINDIENMSMENPNVFTVEQHSICPKNLFDTSVEIFCEKKNSDTAELEESFDEKNLLYDSLSNSDFKDILTDSLEEGKQLKEMLNLSKHATINVSYDKESIMERHNNELLNVEQSSLPNLFDTSVQIVSVKHKDSINPKEFLNNKNILYDSLSNSEIKDVSKDSLEESDKSNEILNISQQSSSDNFAKSGDVFQKQIDKENIIERYDNESLNVEQNSICPFPNLFDTSVQIISEKHKDSSGIIPKESLDDKNISCDSLLNSEVKCVSKDSLEESDKLNEILNISQQSSEDNFVKSEDICQKQNVLETSVQIIYDNASNCIEKESINEINSNSKENFDNYKSFQETSNEQVKIDTCSAQPAASKNFCPSQNFSDNLETADAVKNTLHSDYHINENKLKPDISVVSDPVITSSSNDISNITKEAFSVESCHLKILNNDENVDKDLKFQLHIEVTVGDKKCQIASQDIKMVQVASGGYRSENDFISTVSITNPVSHSISSVASHNDRNDHVMHLNNQEINLENTDCNAFRVHSSSQMNSSSRKKSENAFTSHITQRAKSSASQTSCMKFDCMDSFNDVSLLQALDLSDLSASFLNESVIQSKDSLMPLNLYSLDECLQNFHTPQFKNKNKENIPEDTQMFESGKFCARRKSSSPNKVYDSKTPQSLKKCSSFKETNKKTPGTKIPVRKVDNFIVPALTPSKFAKPFPTTLSAEKAKKCQHSPHSVDSDKKTTPNKIPHICKVRNTIFSKVPQIIPSKKYMNVQSPVAQYINGPVKTPEPVLRDCMNRLMESPHHLHHAHTSGSLKSTKKKA